MIGAVYAGGFARLHRALPDRFPRWRRTAFAGGLLTLWIALASPLDAWAGVSLQAHMLQHLLLMMGAPPLLLLGAPFAPILRGLPRAMRHDVLGPYLAEPMLQRIARRALHPVTGWLALAAATWLWHLPAAYERALASAGWHAVEHGVFFAAALLFWWPVIEPWPWRSPWPRAAMIPYLVLADLQNTAFSALFAFSDRVFYPSYAALAGSDGAALADQAAAGALMWVLSSLAFLVPVGFVVRELLEPAALRATRSPPVATVPSRLRPPFDLLRIRGVGAWLRAPGFRRAAQATCAALALAVVVDGLFGPRTSPWNLASVLPWTYWRAFVVVGLLVAGNLFCFACPFVGARDLGRRLLPARWRWPRALRSKWLAVAILAAYLVGYEAFDLWDDPRATAVLVLAYFAGAVLVDGLFRGASFCRFVCPIGQFHFLGATLSPLEVKVRDRAVCAGCTTRDCIRGNATSRGCELALFAPAKVGNLDCTFCLDCVRACPHDNVGLRTAAPARELADDGPRSSFGRLSRRADLAALAGVTSAGAFANAAAMIAPAAGAIEGLGTALGSVAAARGLVLGLAVTALPLALGTLVVAAGRALSGVKQSFPRLLTRFAFAFLPLGFSLWTAHFLFHFVTAWRSLGATLDRLAGDASEGPLAAHLGTPPSVLLDFEILLLDLGLLLSLLTVWRIARRLAPGRRRGLALAAPIAALAVLGWALGVWILVQPMQMRGMIHG